MTCPFLIPFYVKYSCMLRAMNHSHKLSHKIHPQRHCQQTSNAPYPPLASNSSTPRQSDSLTDHAHPSLVKSLQPHLHRPLFLPSINILVSIPPSDAKANPPRPPPNHDSCRIFQFITIIPGHRSNSTPPRHPSRRQRRWTLSLHPERAPVDDKSPREDLNKAGKLSAYGHHGAACASQTSPRGINASTNIRGFQDHGPRGKHINPR